MRPDGSSKGEAEAAGALEGLKWLGKGLLALLFFLLGMVAGKHC